MEGQVNKGDKPSLSIGQAAFLLLRVRKVFRKKIALKKEKNYGQDVVFPKTELTASTRRKSRIPPLIRSRTVPAIIVPFSILQAQIVKTSTGANVVNQPQANSSQSQPYQQSKSDYSTPGVDFVQFLTTSVSPCSSVAGTPPTKRDRDFAGLSSSSIFRDSGGDSSWNVNLGSTANASSSTLSSSCQSGGSENVGGSSPVPQGSPFFGGSGVPSGSKGLSRLARLLNAPAGQSKQNQQYLLPGGQEPGGLSWPSPRPLRRRRSLENEDLSLCRPRAESIDSLIRRNNFLDATTSKALAKRFSACPNLKVDMKLSEGLITAVEQGNVAKVKTILETADVDINSLAADGLSLLDVAAIQRNGPMVKLLLANGATENQYGKESISDQLNSMAQEAEKKSEDLMARILKCSTFGNLSSAQLKELEKEFHVWEKRYKKFRKMRTEYSQIRPPDPPLKVTLDVCSSTSVKIKFQESENLDNMFCTKYKIEWSTEEEFDFSNGSTQVMEIFDLRKLETILSHLNVGQRYYFRIACGNCKGYGAYQNSIPFSIIPSSWRDIDGKKPRYAGKSIVFDDIFSQIRSTRPEYASEIRSIDFSSEVSSSSTQPSNANLQQGKKNQKIISIKHLFAAAPKFQKSFKRGIFLSCVIYSEDKLLVTTEDFLPTIEIDETFPSSLHNDFHWLLKVSSTWEDVKSLKSDMEKSGSASTFHFRLKLLQASAAMQTALGMGDLGRLYYKTIGDSKNSVVIISTINYVRSMKLISSLNLKWVPLTKMSSRKSSDDISDVLINSIQEQILYHQVSNIPLGRGLYLGYLKLASSVDLLKIVVPEKTPNFLPHTKIRDNPHVSSEEWTLIQKMVKSKSLESLSSYEANNNMADEEDNGSTEEQINNSENISILSSNGSLGNTSPAPNSNNVINNNSLVQEFSEAQEIFRAQLSTALKRLFSYLEIDSEFSLTHRLYSLEVVEASSSVSLLVVCPSLDNVCLLAGQSDKLLQRNDLIPLPVQVFEMIHLNTYQKEFITRYARLSAILEMDTILAQHNQREAFSSAELTLAKQRLNQLHEFQSQIDTTWRGSRWVIDVVTGARDKSSPTSSIRTLLQYDLKNSSESIVSADACFRKDELGLGLHSLSDQQIPFGVTSGGMKFSRSENQLALHQGPSGSPFPSRPQQPAMRKVSVPIQSAIGPAAINKEKLHFTPKIYSNHSQSDSTISHSSTFDPASSTSLHNLYRHSSSSQMVLGAPGGNPQILIPNLIISSADDHPLTPTQDEETEGSNEETQVPVPCPFVRSHLKSSSEPPPVPPRRSLPTPPSSGRISSIDSPDPNLDLRVFAALDPPHLPGVPGTPSSRHFGSASVSSASSSSATSVVEFQVGEFTIPNSAPPPVPAIIQVYAAYDCGLAEGTSVRLQVTSQTTARQVVDLVVKQLNSEVEAKGLSQPIYERSQDFCLVSVIGARERCLRNDFKPLLLQNPWKSGRLYLRKKTEVTAAINMNNGRDSSQL